jgi:hypothetical protein
MRRATHRSGRVRRDHLAGHQPVEQVTQRGQAQLGRRGRMIVRLLLDPSGDVQLSSDIRNPAVGDIENPATSVMLMSRSKPLRL